MYSLIWTVIGKTKTSKLFSAWWINYLSVEVNRVAPQHSPRLHISSAINIKLSWDNRRVAFILYLFHSFVVTSDYFFYKVGVNFYASINGKVREKEKHITYYVERQKHWLCRTNYSFFYFLSFFQLMCAKLM